MNESLLTKQDVAKLLQVSTRTVHRLIVTGQLSTMKVGRMVRFDPVKLAKDMGKFHQRVLA